MNPLSESAMLLIADFFVTFMTLFMTVATRREMKAVREQQQNDQASRRKPQPLEDDGATEEVADLDLGAKLEGGPRETVRRQARKRTLKDHLHPLEEIEEEDVLIEDCSIQPPCGNYLWSCICVRAPTAAAVQAKKQAAAASSSAPVSRPDEASEIPTSVPSSTRSCAESETVSEAPWDEDDSKRPNFSGVWVLERVDGEVDKFLADMQQGWFVRSGGRACRYGIGRVQITCRHEGNSIYFEKVLADPMKGTARIPINIGEGTTTYQDDIGAVTACCDWKGDALVFKASTESTKLPVSLRMYYDREGHFVEEMTSCNNTTIHYVFKAASA
eukprot:CAMPEP_0206481222 /NCGR_PEP_ID=MMETSP0324_2-20121206/38004_1 /ASSEMBLY_ACC=CAM_ASM_000836 /TAXON_ID=2866 /ORGANISM="Crypthecodinium cohnii, Strain Seligo" /LENGTH=329 /DNA_ID=CAMNT_0053958645 /DNA_START=152 /DNA_END=1141 /DNA_ORIENTATION=-